MPKLSAPDAEFYPDKEGFIRSIHAQLLIESILDVGTGYGGVFDYEYWDSKASVNKRAACDIFWIKQMSDRWETKVGVDVQYLSASYGEKSFDLVQCMETLEHVDNMKLSVEQLCAVARKIVIITSGDETHHERQAESEKLNKHQKYKAHPEVSLLREMGFTVRRDNLTKRQLIAWKIL